MTPFLRSETHTALESNGFAGHILEVGGSKLYAYSADLQLGVSVVTHGRHMNVSLESVRISVLELFKLSSPRKRTHNIYIDTVLAPLGSRNSCKTTDTLLCGGV